MGGGDFIYRKFNFMSYEKVKNFSIKKDGTINITSSCSNTTAGYSTWRFNGSIYSFIQSVMSGSLYLQDTSHKNIYTRKVIYQARDELAQLLEGIPFNVRYNRSGKKLVYDLMGIFISHVEEGKEIKDICQDIIAENKKSPPSFQMTEERIKEYKNLPKHLGNKIKKIEQIFKTTFHRVLTAREEKNLYVFKFHNGKYMKKITRRTVFFDYDEKNALKASMLVWEEKYKSVLSYYQQQGELIAI